MILSGVAQALIDIPSGTGPAALGGVARRNFRRWRPIFERVGTDMGVAPAFLAAVSKRESNARWEANSVGPELPDRSHARGLMQVTDENLERMGISDWADPETNVRAGARILLEPPAPYGEVPIGKTLARYGGFVDTDPTDYITYIEVAYLAMWLREGMDPRPEP